VLLDAIVVTLLPLMIAQLVKQQTFIKAAVFPAVLQASLLTTKHALV